MKRKISLLCFCLCVGFIFYNSSLPAIESSNISEGLTYKIYEFLNLNIDFELFHVFVRKLAHFTEYFGLGLFAYYAFDFKLAFILCCLVACCDETLQLFVEGRSGQVSDVLLDSIGSSCSIVLLKMKEKLYVRFNKKEL